MRKKIFLIIMLLFFVSFSKTIVYAEDTEDIIQEINELVSDSLEEVDEEDNSAYQLMRIVVFADKLVQDYGASTVIENPEYHQYVLQFDTKADTKKAYQLIQKESSYDGYFLDEVLTSEDVIFSSDFKSNSWGTYTMGLDKLATQSEQYQINTNIKVAVIDTGVDKSHSILKGRVDSTSYNLAENNTDLEDNLGHGTHVAGIVADSTSDNIKIMALKIFNSSNRSSTILILNALQYAVEKGADVVNMSIGVDTNATSSTQKQLDVVIDKAYELGIPIFAAAGNSSKNVSTVYPASNSKTIAISAVNKDLNFDSSYSNYGAGIDFCAPGTAIVSAQAGGGLTTQEGTSMASPHMAAAGAMIKNLHKNYSVSQVYQVLQKYAKDLGSKGKDIYYGNGLVDLSTYYQDEKVSTKTSIKNYKVTLSKTSYTYNGEAKKPKVTVKNLSSKNYSVSYKNNKNAGTATVTVTGKGNYKDSIKTTFKIKKASIQLASSSKVTTKSYTGKAIKPNVKLTYKSKTLKKNTDYTLSYKNNKKVGTATITIKGKGNFTGTKTLTFKIKESYTKYKVRVGMLNYRIKPGNTYRIKGILRKKQVIKVVNGYSKKSRGDIWVKIFYKNKYYYVNSKYLTKVR